MTKINKLLIYLMRRDLRVADNPILDELTKNSAKHGFTHLLPLYVFAAQQIEVSGFIKEDEEQKSPYPEARSRIAGFWRCGPHRAKFISECLEDVQRELKNIGNDLCIRVGITGHVIQDMLAKYAAQNIKVGAVWMVGEYGSEEMEDEVAVQKACKAAKVGFRTWSDEKYLIDDRDLPFERVTEIPDVFTSFRKYFEPLNQTPRNVLPTPRKGSLPLYPEFIPPQLLPFSIPSSFQDIEKALLKPIKAADLINNPPKLPPDALTSFPLKGGCSHALERTRHLLVSSSFTRYHDTRNGLIGLDYSTKLSSYLALGCITSRQIHQALLSLENGTDSSLSHVEGYGKGENSGTKATRFELLWRDYMRQCARKFGSKLFYLTGFRDQYDRVQKWHSLSRPLPGSSKAQIQKMVERFLNGTTGMGLIDASQRELYHTGYTSNRTRQNVASFLAKHLKIDWRIGAEWYETMLIDHDVSSNWGNWQYVSGVGNDPRGEDRVFNPVKQAYDYDPNAEYIMTWCPELRVDGLNVGERFQAWTIPEIKRQALGLKGLESVENPLKKIQFSASHGGSGRGGGINSRRNTGRENKSRGGYGCRGYGSTRGYVTSSRVRGSNS
ncbi:putative cryptochrome DASH, mitochondrial [Golovinomyces cichoracearum]|uniref:Cryptochrome DASH n=1 Tax=Golovinomyces cichoracearum TaxID=62708 RepID=A0A420IUV1_9PEZI|nr:putative cryptochrome DASH, mitochondrial [Golovinomyces cichoracearum]